MFQSNEINSTLALDLKIFIDLSLALIVEIFLTA